MLLQFAELNVVLQSNYFFRALSAKERFLVEISSVVFLQRREPEDRPQADALFEFVRRRNRGAAKTLLVEVVQCSSERHKSEFRRRPEFWALSVLAKSDGTVNQTLVRKFLLVLRSVCAAGAGEAAWLRSLEQDAAHYAKGENEVRFDLQEEPLQSVWKKARALLASAEKEKGLGFLALQDRLHRDFHRLRLLALRPNITRGLPQMKKALRIQKQRVRKRQLEYISQLGPESGLYLFVDALSSLSASERVAFLGLLEVLFEHRRLCGVFDGRREQWLQTVNYFREMAQVFEVLCAVSKKPQLEEIAEIDTLKQRVRQLPRLAAEVFAEGSPQELVNGDLDVMSIEWLEAFLGEADAQFRREGVRVRVLSVVGLQSSGKSTFLNSLFNLTFRVGDGRATRGASAVLFKVDAQSFSEMEGVADYLVVVDTEGLASPDTLAKLQGADGKSLMNMRDNKMLLINAGVADFCVINEFGEIKTPLLDVLSMLMYSFWRLEHLKLRPRLNVAVQNRDNLDRAQENLWNNLQGNLQGKQRLIQKANPNANLLSVDLLLCFEGDKKQILQLLPGLGEASELRSNYFAGVERFRADLFSRELGFAGRGCGFRTLSARLRAVFKATFYDDVHFNSLDFSKMGAGKKRQFIELELEKEALLVIDRLIEESAPSSLDELNRAETRILGGGGARPGPVRQEIVAKRELRFEKGIPALQRSF